MQLAQGGTAKLADAVLRRGVYMNVTAVNLCMEHEMQDHPDFAADMADLTRLEHEARQMRAAFMAEMLATAWHGLTNLFAPRRTAS